MAIQTTTSSGSSSGCDYALPIDLTELFAAPDGRLAGGVVVVDAAVVVIRASDGREWTVPVEGTGAGFGRGFYVVALDPSVVLREVVAKSADGRELGRKSADSAGERRAIDRMYPSSGGS
jgi:hypothetical protein